MKGRALFDWFSRQSALFFIVNIIILSEIFTSMMSVILRGRITADYLITGGIVSLITGSAVVFVMRHIARLGEKTIELEKDVEHRKKIQQTLLKSSNEWRATVDSTSDMIILLDKEGHIVKTNRATAEFAGCDLLSLLGRSVYTLFDETDLPPGQHPFRRMRDSGKMIVTEVQVSSSEAWYLMSAELIKEDLNPSLGGVVIVRNITQVKLMEEALARAANRMETLLERSPFGILVVNDQGAIEYANPAMLALSGFERSHFVGRNILDLSGCVPEEMKASLASAFEGTPFRFGPSEYNCTSGSKRSFANFTGIPLSEQGKSKALVIIEDVSDLKNAEEERQQLNMILQQVQKTESIGKLAGGIAHDFNNILLAIMGFSDAATEKLPPGHPAAVDLETVIEAAENGADLVRQILAYSRQQDLAIKPLDLNAMVAEAGSMLRRMLPKNISIEVLPAYEPCPIMGDHVQIGQVIFNLALNARDAMPDGGTLSLETGITTIESGDGGKAAGLPPGPYSFLSVRDTGSGMEEEALERIFEPFFTTKNEQGTGLGLSTASGIAAQHGGVIHVESEPGKGSTFTVHFPFALVTEPATQDSTSPHPTETILLVDDKKPTRRVISDRLKKLGYCVITAAKAKEALALFEQEQGSIDLLLCDMILPGMSGPVLAAKLRRLQPSLMVVFMSSHPEEMHYREHLLESGNAFISKSMGAGEIARNIRGIIAQGRSQ